MAWEILTDQDGTLTARSRAPPAPTRTRGDVLESVTFRFSDQVDYDTFQRYLHFVGNVSTFTDVDGEPGYRELQVDAKSLLMQFTPTSSIPTIEGFWGVVVDGQVESPLPPAQLDVSIDVFYLAEASDYANHSDVRTVHEV